MITASLLTRAAALRAALTAALGAALTLLLTAPLALAAGTSTTTSSSEKTPVDLTGASSPSHAGSGSSIVRTIVGLAVVIGVIYGVAWVLKQRKAGRQERPTGVGLATVASVPLGPKGSVHLVRVGRELLIVGVGDHGVTPIRTYAEHEARAAGLLDEAGDLIAPLDDVVVASRRRRIPGSFELRPRALVEQARSWTVRR
jgi:flagellar protein FliO/FliZ